MLNYAQWQAKLKKWADKFPSANAAANEMARRTLKDYGVECNPYTLMYHLRGDYNDVRLRMAHAVYMVIFTDEHANLGVDE